METTLSGNDGALLLLLAALLIALIIERLLEILKASLDVIEVKFDGHRFWNNRAYELQARWESLLEHRPSQKLMNRLGLAPVQLENSAYRQAPSISSLRLRNTTLTYAAKVFGITLGVCIAWLAEIDIFVLVNQLTGNENTSPLFGPWFTKTCTGVAMGLGAGPLHSIIARLEHAKRARVDATSLKGD